MKASLRLKGGLNYNKDRVLLNDVENGVDRWRNTFGISLGNRKRKKVDIRVGVDFTFNRSEYEDEAQGVQRFSNQKYYLNGDADLGKWQLDTKFSYTQFRGAAFAGNTNLPLWSASLSRYILKADRGQLKLSVFDVLNQNTGISRSTNLNYIQDDRINSLGRYFMLTFAYSIKGFGGNSGGIKVFK